MTLTITALKLHAFFGAYFSHHDDEKNKIKIEWESANKEAQNTSNKL